MNRVTSTHMNSPRIGAATFFKVNSHRHTYINIRTCSTPPHASLLFSPVCRWLCLSRSISRADVWSSPQSAATSMTAAWTTSAPSEWRVERESPSLYACKSPWTVDWLCVSVKWRYSDNETGSSVQAPTKACNLWGHSVLHVVSIQHVRGRLSCFCHSFFYFWWIAQKGFLLWTPRGPNWAF